MFCFKIGKFKKQVFTIKRKTKLAIFTITQVVTYDDWIISTDNNGKYYARLQGFPDWFKFSGTNRDAYRQIGNAVPVPMGRWIGHQVQRYFRTK